jgi:hypothetical protein
LTVISMYPGIWNATGKEAGALIDWCWHESTFYPVNGEKILKVLKMHVNGMDFNNNNTFQEATFFMKRVNQFLSHVSD